MNEKRPCPHCATPIGADFKACPHCGRSFEPPTPAVNVQDAEHLRLLSIFHYVVAAILALFACFPLIHDRPSVKALFDSESAPVSNP